MGLPGSNRTDWQLPPGVSKGTWDYVRSATIASDYDDYFRDHGLLSFDEQLLFEWFEDTGTVIDFGCGTGRALVKLLARGMSGIGVDLSLPMLNQAQEQLAPFVDRFTAVRANLVELDGLRDNIADYSICLFSTLGMIHGAECRSRAIHNMQRVVKPGGLMVFHVHNFWFNLYDPGGPWWLIKSFLSKSNRQRGDKNYNYRGIRGFYLHVFGRREFQRLLVQNGLTILEWVPLRSTCDGRLKYPWLLQSLRSPGWIVCCRKTRNPRD